MRNRLRAFGLVVLSVMVLLVGMAQVKPVRGRKPKTIRAKVPKAAKVKAGTVKACRAMYMKGRYDEAAVGYKKLLSKGNQRFAAAIGLAEALSAKGRYAEALDTLKLVASAGAKNAGWHVARAELLYTLGRYDEALKHATKAHTLQPTFAPAILICGRLLETLGREKQAIEVYRSMSKVIDENKYSNNARSLTALGQIMDRFAILTGRKASAQAANILNNYLRQARKVDKTYWPAHVAAGNFLLSKHRPRLAAKEFGQAARLNKNCIDAHIGMGAVLLNKWQFEKCMGAVNTALKINPHSADAMILKAVCLMQWRKFDQVAPVVEQVLKINPNHLDALSLLAAVNIRTHKPNKAKPFIERVGKINPRYASLPNTIAQWLAAGRQFKEAEKYYKQAIKLAPKRAEGYTNLGRAYMQTGQEDKARAILAKAHLIDDYRGDVINYLQVLKDLEGFLVKETEHFIVKVSAKHDAVLLDSMSAYMEEIYKDVCGDFNHEPPVKTIIEIFPTHPGFSKRISGRGWIGTIGACTGRVIAMVAPNSERSRFGTFNWPSVLRHEFTHTVTLSATNNRIPHWFTEACAVWEQPDRRSYDAVKRLVAATRAGRLFPVGKLNWGFVRPKRRGDRGLAYAQSEWIMEYIISTRRYPTIIRMIECFRDAWPQERVFKEILGMTEAQFDKTFHAWAKKEIEKWGFDSKKTPNLRMATEAVKKNPKSAAVQADLAVALYMRGKVAPAEKAARKALDIDKNNVKAQGVLAYILLRQKKYDMAIQAAVRLEKLDNNSRVAPYVLAKCYIAKRKGTMAIEALEKLKFRKPLDPYSYSELAKLYMQLGKPRKALPNLIELHRRTMKDHKYARQIAEIYGMMGGHNDQALKFWYEVININPYEVSAYKAMTEIHIVARRYAEAVATARLMHLADPKSAEAWTYLAIARYRFGRANKDKAQLVKAKQAAQKALKIDPNFSKAKDVIELIDLLAESERP